MSMTSKPNSSTPGTGGLLPVQLVEEIRNLAQAAAQRLAVGLGDRIGAATERLAEYAADGAGSAGTAGVSEGVRQLAKGRSPLRAMVGAGVAGGKEKLRQMTRGSRGKGNDKDKAKAKATNIVEAIDVGVPVHVAYNQWTQFEDFPGFTKKIQHVEQQSERRLIWKAQIFWSHRSWESTIVEQIPDKRIVWRSTGEKGSVDGTVTFHPLEDELTRILLVLEYHPQGLFERTGNIWRAQGRRVRLELKRFATHVMTRTILHPDDVEGWRGEIRDGRVVEDHRPDSSEPERREPEPREQEHREQDHRPDSAAQERREPEPPPRRRGKDEDRHEEPAEPTRPRRPLRRGEGPGTRPTVRRARTSERSER